MAEIKAKAQIEAKVILVLSEDEARALYNITIYGVKPFTSWFYKNLGKHYLQPFHEGVVSLFDTVFKEMPKELNRIDEARKAFKKN